MANLSNDKASLLLAKDQYVSFKDPAQMQIAILFHLRTDTTYLNEDTIALQ